jgi:hypothetical protein
VVCCSASRWMADSMPARCQVATAATPMTITDPHIFLLGRPPIEEYLSFVIQAAGPKADTKAAVDMWRDGAALHLLTTTEVPSNDPSQSPSFFPGDGLHTTRPKEGG